MKSTRKKVAVFFGGRSPEHDVSVVTGLQVLQAIDQTQYDPFPVYIAADGEWRIDANADDTVLWDRGNFLLKNESLQKTLPVTLDVQGKRGGRLLPKYDGAFAQFIGQAIHKQKPIEFDIAMPCFHGLNGEDGGFQGLFELANIPYTGMRKMACAALMDKAATKKILQAVDVPVLPYAVIKRPYKSFVVDEAQIKSLTKHLTYPCIIKPVHLGSSIGVAKVKNAKEVKACLPEIFKWDDSAILEPFVENLVEYNIGVSKVFGAVEFSAIERPKGSDDLLDFKQKYLSGGDDKTGNKLGNKMGGNQPASQKQPGATSSEGMLSLTRELNPKLTKKMSGEIETYARAMFEAVDGMGAPRIDFIGNTKTKEIWLNEVNPTPGSFAYFLWEARVQEPKLFTELLTAMLIEAIDDNHAHALPKDPVPKEARLFKR